MDIAPDGIQPSAPAGPAGPADGATIGSPSGVVVSLAITERAGALGVRASTLRFWEKAGLVAPERIVTKAGPARRYPLAAIREARITAALRAAGYRIPDVQRAITAIRDLHHAGHPLAALDGTVGTLAQRTLALLRAGTTLSEIIQPAPAGPART